jgi:arginase
MPTAAWTSLFFPDWQSAGTTRAHEGALALRRALSSREPFLEVPVRTSEPAALAAYAPPDQTIVGRAAVVEGLRHAVASLETAAPTRLFSILGTCGAELAPVSYLNARCRGDLAVVWLDAHGDLNTPRSSPSKRFHGMILRTLLGEGDADLTALVARPLEPAQVVLAGTRDLDPPERELIAARRVTMVPPMSMQAGPAVLLAAVRGTGRRHVYIHLDLDVIDPAEFPNVIVPAKDGVSVAAVERAIHALMTTFDCVGFSVVEYAPGPQDLTGVVGTIVEAVLGQD